MTSYDVKALFTSVPMDHSINIVEHELLQNPLLSQRTSISIQQIITLLEFYLKNTYFLFQGKYYKQVHGAAMGSPISYLIANLFMEEFEVKALSSAPYPHPTPMAKVCGQHLCYPASKTQSTITIIHNLIGSTYTVHPTGTKPRRSPTFPGHFGFSRSQQHSIVTTVYRKPTHTNQYVHLDSNYLITAKNNVFNTVAFRAKVVCTSQQALQKEMKHIRKALKACNFPLWALNNQQNKFNHKHNIHNGQTTTSNQSNNINNHESNSKNMSIVVPYIHGLGESFKRTCNSLGIQVYFKESNTIETLLMAPKDRDNKLQKSGVIYRF